MTFSVADQYASASESTAVMIYDASVADSTTTEGLSSDRRYVGLLNQGATCYMNSLLQALYMTPEFRLAIYKWKYNPEKDGDAEMCIPLQLQKLFGLLQLSTSNAISTVALTKSFGWDSNEVFQQQDVQELCRKLMEALEDAFKSTNEEKVIDELFSGELIDYIKCIDIEHESEKRDKFLDFSLAIKPFDSDVIMHSLSECIESYLKPELLDGDNMIRVDSVDRKVPAIKGLKIGKLPHVMSVHLKRFVFDFTGPSIVQKKLNDQVRFPLVLDMNKYVAGRKRVRESMEGATLQRLDSVEGNEFELFLKAQIQHLRAKSNTPGTPEEIDLGDPTVPDLVDCNGAMSPDQIAEEEAQYPEEARLDAQAVGALLATRGEWVYELYAVLIHSGASSGGHYYAYIKDLGAADDCWWNFNDSSVTRIDASKVSEAWGGKTRTASGVAKYSWASGLGGLNMSNAYMLYYRKVSADGHYAKFPDAASIPAHVRELVEQHDREQVAREAEEEERKNVLKLRVHWKKIEMEVLTKRSVTYNQLLEQLWLDFNIAEDFAEDARVSPLEVLRLRRFSAYNATPLQAFDVKSSGTVKLSHLPLNEYNTYFLEARKSGEAFEEYDEGGMSVNLVTVSASGESFEDAKIVRLKKSATVADLLAVMAGWGEMSEDSIRVVRFNVTYDKQTPEVISDFRDKRLKEDLAIFESQKLYYDCYSSVPVEDSDLCKVFMMVVNMISIRINHPPSPDINKTITVDRRVTPRQLREVVAKEVGRSPESVYMFRSYSRGVEIKDGAESIYSLGIHHSVFVDFYPAPPAGEFRLQGFVVPDDYVAGFISPDVPCPELVAVEPPTVDSAELAQTGLSEASPSESTALDPPRAKSPAATEALVNFDVSDFDIFQTGENGASQTAATEFSISRVGVHIKYTSENLEGIDTEGYAITADTVVRDVKTALLGQFISRGRLPPHATIDWIRLWEKLGSHKGKLLKYDSKSLSSNGFSVCDWRHMYVQLLPSYRPLPGQSETDVLLLVQRFRRNTWSMGPMAELAVSTTMSIQGLFDTLSVVSGIAAENLKVLVLFSYSEVSLCGLDDDPYLLAKNMRWFRKPTEHQDQTVFEWYAHLSHGHLKSEFADGTLLLIQDTSEPLRPLTADEKSSQHKIIDGDSYFNPSLFSSSAATSTVYRNGSKLEKGIHIKSRTEKEGDATSSSPSLEQKTELNFDVTKFDIF